MLSPFYFFSPLLSTFHKRTYYDTFFLWIILFFSLLAGITSFAILISVAWLCIFINWKYIFFC